ncbi:hypothetical protein EPUS_00542 [Endocarpon pusillum Z07020]|uniref:Uncharacterized protein n=1 Tax=Endocarpon pusillum (strain Z07020 / HMAS-L-300199) TaxID=1263415 RepID=U1GHG0_ENDPU|nr:uncharacterized protein EPUS_00542 [Endocarpon pusillum Z07020]ERF71553.1 hypothetical protein EPUS_00542 [Endocarpon pusillum Z07020]
MASSTSSSAGIIAELANNLQNIDLQLPDDPAQGHSVPYPPGLDDIARRAEFEVAFIAFTRLVDLHLKFGDSLKNITIPSDSEVFRKATKTQIARAKVQAVSKLGFRIWKEQYGYTATRDDGKALWSNASFDRWAETRINEMRETLLAYSNNEEWRAQL